jgi:hypothetical protein
VPLLLALEPGARARLAKVARLRFATRKHGLADEARPKFGGDIRSTGGKRTVKQGAADRDPTDAEALEATIREALGSGADAFLKDVADEEPVRGGDISSGRSFSRRLGLARLLSSRNKPAIERRMPALLQALRGLQLAKNFDPSNEAAPEYLNAARELARGHFRHVVFGHTHLKKKVDLGGGRLYLNSGTWADVLEFPREILDAPQDVALARLTAFAEKMADGDFRDLVLDDRSYVLIELNERDRAARVELASFRDGKLI